MWVSRHETNLLQGGLIECAAINFQQEDRVRALEDQLQAASMNARQIEADAAGAMSKARILEAELGEAIS